MCNRLKCRAHFPIYVPYFSKSREMLCLAHYLSNEQCCLRLNTSHNGRLTLFVFLVLSLFIKTKKFCRLHHELPQIVHVPFSHIKFACFWQLDQPACLPPFCPSLLPPLPSRFTIMSFSPLYSFSPCGGLGVFIKETVSSKTDSCCVLWIPWLTLFLFMLKILKVAQISRQLKSRVLPLIEDGQIFYFCDMSNHRFDSFPDNLSLAFSNLKPGCTFLPTFNGLRVCFHSSAQYQFPASFQGSDCPTLL